MTINKAEDQSLKEMDTDFREECFPHKWLAQKLFLQKAYLYWHPQGKQQV
jgi:hypothetical protein